MKLIRCDYDDSGAITGVTINNNGQDVRFEPVRIGEWVMMAGFPACSKCGCSPADWEAKPDNPSGFPPYCHSCGVKMYGGVEGCTN